VPLKQPIIEDLRHHSAESLSELRQLIAHGALLRADANRPSFFELDGDEQVFYVHITPHDGKVWLLATWPRQVGSGSAVAEKKVAA